MITLEEVREEKYNEIDKIFTLAYVFKTWVKTNKDTNKLGVKRIYGGIEMEENI